MGRSVLGLYTVAQYVLKNTFNLTFQLMSPVAASGQGTDSSLHTQNHYLTHREWDHFMM